MYEAHFGLKRRPFAATPDPLCFLSTAATQSALDEIVVCAEQGQGIAVLSAPAGTGKTLLCERLRSELAERFEIIILPHASFLTRRALLQTILCELNHSYRIQDEQELRLELIPAIRSLRPQREALVLICDEAHQLPEELLEELRILADLAERGRPLVRLVLFGQLGLEETLALPSLEALSQRIRAHVCLEPLSHVDSLDYIDYRITWAGGRTEEIFEPEALELVCRAADGVPRCLNQLCDHALLLAYVAEMPTVTVEVIREALHDLRQLPLHWNESILETRSFVETTETETDFVETTGASASFEDRDVRMESIEIGNDDLAQRDLHNIHAVTPTTSESSSDLEESDSLDSDDIEIDSNEDDVENFLHESSLQEPTSTSDWEDATIQTTKLVPLAPAIWNPTSFELSATKQSGGFIEEIVVDRYAAIDAGLQPPETNSADNPKSAQVRQEVAIDSASSAATSSFEGTGSSKNGDTAIHEKTIAADCSETEPTLVTPVEVRSSADFEAVCHRLDELLPQVDEQVSWETSSVRSEFAAGAEDASRSQSNEASEATIEASSSTEEWLGREVCQLAEQLQETIGIPSRDGSAVAQLRSLLTEEKEEAAYVERPAVESDSTSAQPEAMPSIEVGSAKEAVTEPTREAARPYRNLFSMLRRKQQGLM